MKDPPQSDRGKKKTAICLRLVKLREVKGDVGTSFEGWICKYRGFGCKKWVWVWIWFQTFRTGLWRDGLGKIGFKL